MTHAAARGKRFQRIGLSLAALDWLVAVGWPQTYRSWRLFRHFSPWEETTVFCLLAVSLVGFVLSLAGAFRQAGDEAAEWRSVTGMVLNVPPFLVFGLLCKALDPTGL